MLATGPLLRRLAEAAIERQELAFYGALPKGMVVGVLAEYGKDKDRRGAKLPHWLTLWLVLSMGFLRDLDLPTVLDRIALTFGAPPRWQGRVPHSTSLAKARDRLGFDVVRALFRRFAGFLGRELNDRDRWRGLVPVSIDGTMLDVPDTPANVAAFERPGGRNGSGAFPKLRLVALVSTVSHFVLGCVLAPCKGKGTGEGSLALSLAALLQKDWLLLADRAFCAYPLLEALSDRPFFVRKTTGPTAVKPAKIETLKRRKDYWVDYLPTSVAKRGGSPLRLRWVRIRVQNTLSPLPWLTVPPARNPLPRGRHDEAIQA